MTGAVSPMKNVTLEPGDMADLVYAKRLLEHPGFAIRLASLVGTPIEKGFQMLPRRFSKPIQWSVDLALRAALRVALTSLHSKRRGAPATPGIHQVAAGVTGCVGGAFGLVALPVELPLSTTVILRSIADIARSEGHDLRIAETRLSCMEVFALGGRSVSDDAGENAYWAMRTVMAGAVSEAAVFVARYGMSHESAPALLRFVSLIAARFGVLVTEQIMAKALPVIGAVTGSAINLLFITHFQSMARGHFIVRRLERRYTPALVRTVYDQIDSSSGSEREH